MYLCTSQSRINIYIIFYIFIYTYIHWQAINQPLKKKKRHNCGNYRPYTTDSKTSKHKVVRQGQEGPNGRGKELWLAQNFQDVYLITSIVTRLYLGLQAQKVLFRFTVLSEYFTL